MKRVVAALTAPCAAVLAALVSSCTQVRETSVGEAYAYAPTQAQYTWMLPKTVVSASVVYTLEDCDEENAKLRISPRITLSNISEPDIDLGPDFPNGMISITPEELVSFWQDSDVTVKTHGSTHTLQYIGAKPANQAGPIIGSFVTTAAKLTAVALGVPASAPTAGGAPFCGSAKATLEKMRALQSRLSSAEVTPEDVKNLPGQIASMQGALSITVQKAFDPGAKNIPIDKNAGRAFIGSVKPTSSQLAQTKWFASEKMAEYAFKNSKDLKIDLYLDLKKSFPLNVLKNAVVCDDAEKCLLSRVPATKGTLFREVAYIPVLAFQASDASAPAASKTFPFGQFGTPRTLPLTAGLFQQLTWSVTFSDTGEIAESTFTSKATGMALANLLASIGSASNSVAIENRAANVLADPATTRLDNENKALKAQIDNLNYSQQLQALLAAQGR